MLGPSKAGKTCALAAFEAACYVDAQDPTCTLGVTSDRDGDNDDPLGRFMVRWIGRDQPLPNTDHKRDYRVQVTTRVAGGMFRPERVHATWLHCGDGRGEDIFTIGDEASDTQSKEGEARMLADARNATTLVLAVDSTAPALELIETHLQRRLDQIAEATSGEEPAHPIGYRLLRRLGLGATVPPPPWRRRLRAARFLLLLTKIDVLAEKAWQQLRRNGSRTTPFQIARSIDSIGLAMELLGERPLRRIRRAMGIDAKLAIGVASATGFHRGGETFLSWSRGKDHDHRLREWSPYGIREALRFITTGACEGPVQLVGGESDLSLASPIPLQSNSFVSLERAP